jgi:hypothetical protein
MGLRPVRIDCRNFTDGLKAHLAVSSLAVTTELSPSAIGGQSSMAVSKASPETSSSGRLNCSIRPAQMPLRRIHERGRIISASKMPPSLRATVIDNLAQVAWSGSGCGSTSKRIGVLSWGGKLGDCPWVCMRVSRGQSPGMLVGDSPRVCTRVLRAISSLVAASSRSQAKLARLPYE